MIIASGDEFIAKIAIDHHGEVATRRIPYIGGHPVTIYAGFVLIFSAVV